ncbi:Aste57867_5841 [Aphanomyces stellatus]|uniref:Aste57867_5841 protein n=1 Tax=Aphanomyces stellatus TaxID=120398 RepID=A0A485KF48_9STRA|nr:hypothetical protein As57867_005827 [Aphanomyces stellatus]VFT82864.1 Aste57867_5841 [Aphanomyces stellatus]
MTDRSSIHGFPPPLVNTSLGGTASASSSPAASKPWSFVQMNMSLLPIARPLPVYTSPSSSLLRKQATKSKPHTPNNNQTSEKATSTSISPRHQTGESTSQTTDGKLSLRERVLRKREEMNPSSPRRRPRHPPSEDSWEDASSIESGYDSDVNMLGIIVPCNTPLLSPALQSDDERAGVRVKRILEILDEDRCKEDTMHSSPRTAKRRCPST